MLGLCLLLFYYLGCIALADLNLCTDYVIQVVLKYQRMEIRKLDNTSQAIPLLTSIYLMQPNLVDDIVIAVSLTLCTCTVSPLFFYQEMLVPSSNRFFSPVLYIGNQSHRAQFKFESISVLKMRKICRDPARRAVVDGRVSP